ncbi:phage tail assembly protein [Methylobacterium tardum]|uniref:phage tail assembly protein n=1 Tax=Methylobacterium tardum TaxID=374432 RepID=UPI0036090663
MSGGVEITLDHPIESDGVTHNVITVRPPTAEDFRRARRGNFTRYARGMALAAIVTGCSRDVLRKMEEADAAKVGDFLLRHSA